MIHIKILDSSVDKYHREWRLYACTATDLEYSHPVQASNVAEISPLPSNWDITAEAYLANETLRWIDHFLSLNARWVVSPRVNDRMEEQGVKVPRLEGQTWTVCMYRYQFV